MTKRNTFVKYVVTNSKMEGNQEDICQENIQEKLFNMDLRRNSIKSNKSKETEENTLRFKEMKEMKSRLNIKRIENQKYYDRYLMNEHN